MVSTKSCKSPIARRLKCSTAVSLAFLALPGPTLAQQSATLTDDANGTALETIQVSGDWLGSGLQNSVKRYPGARTVVQKEEIENTGAANIGDVMRRIPGVQSTDNSGTAGSAISLNIGVRGLTGRYSPRSTVLLDGIPLAVAPYGQPQLSFAPVSLNNIESIDVVRGGGAVRYGPQNVGGIINFKTRAIPDEPGLTADASVRYNNYEDGKSNKQYSTFIGSQLDNGLGLALLYSGSDGSSWRAGSEETVNDFALKFRYKLTPTSEFFGKTSYYDVKSRTPGGLTVAQYNADPFQNTRPTDFWSGTRKGFDAGYLNTLSDTQEFEVRTYYNESFRQSVLISYANLVHQPRNYQVLGVEPRYTQRFNLGNTTNDVTVGYRYIRERGDDNNFNQVIASGAQTPQTTFENATDAHTAYIDDKISFGAWRITPGIRFEHIHSTRDDLKTGNTFETKNNKPLPSLSIAYLLNRDITLFTNYTTSFGPVQNTQLNSQTPNNPLIPELAKTIEAGARWKSKQLSAEVTVFNMRFDNQIQQVPGTLPATFMNIGKTKHDGIEIAVDYAFDKDGRLAGLNLFANYTYTRALQDSGVNRGLDVPFYSRTTDTIGARYQTGPWGFNLSSTHQSRQFADNANTIAETADGSNGEIPGFRTLNVQIDWKVPDTKGFDVFAGINNLTDKRYYTRNVDSNAGRMVGAPRMVYVQGRYTF
ncbi:tonB-dependent siderophore receptor family protein [Collimonas arenae]|uniref:TonB-dependent siderophore receptor family protein n=1 Tax=Collimonas arenae TaxID=279058 RepID=A0A127QI02_9BURK|nr:TonB-dependent siderophore receptor [Collimonas arenae]AMO99535.1 tonB-dependent siderophore receptor family protein [Collimonas arenae]AMP09435.1 tonB-dependent siderophore receptor family protein [Collimonas arenae]